jgi:hypothetical protein
LIKKFLGLYEHGAEGDKGEIVIIDEQSDRYGQRAKPKTIRKEAPL